jgi:hypothetical protein
MTYEGTGTDIRTDGKTDSMTYEWTGTDIKTDGQTDTCVKQTNRWKER